MKKKLKWLIPACAAVIAVVVALVLILVSSGGDGEKTAAQQAEFKVYWNVDGKTFRAQTLSRSEDSEGYVHITFSHNGEQIRMPVAGRTLAQKIDALEVMGLEIDENGVVTDCYRIEDMDGQIVANRYFVTAIDGDTVTCNSAPNLKGYDVTFQITEQTGIWDVSMEGVTCGIPGTVKVDDQVIVVLDREGNAEAVYTIPYKAPPDIYWNVERKYNSTTKTTTREMDPTGGYSIELAVNGEMVTVKTRDYEIVQAIDGMSARCFALEFDEDGMVNKVIHAGTACGGGSCASWYSVNEYADNYLNATKLSTGATYSGLVSNNVKAYDVSGQGDFIGQPTTVRVGDTVHCLRDSVGRIVVVFVTNRVADSEMYWNVERKWDYKTSLTTRTPAADGWYYVKVAVRGKQITVRTQNKEHVQTIDGRGARCFGLKLDGDVIQRVYTPDAVTGGGTFASWYDVTALDGQKITCYKMSTEDTRSGTMRTDCEIYNVSSNATMVGEVTQLQVGDRIHAVKDRDGKVCVIYVVTRFLNYPTYYNLNRQWDSTRECTKRTPDAEGYYVFEMAYNGQLVTIKTKSKTVANDIDSQAARCVALSVKDGIAYRAVHAKETVAYKGGPTSSYTYVTSISKYGFKTKKLSGDVVTTTYDETFAGNCKIYNVSANVLSHKGESTTLRVGDYVHCLKNGDGKVALVYVIGRFEDLKVYYNLDRQWDDAAQITKRVPDAEGCYVFQMAHDGQEVTVKTTSLEVANAIDSQSAKVLGIEFDQNGLAIKAVHAQYTNECKGGIGVSYATITAIEGNKVTTIKSGTTTTFTISNNPNVFDVSGNHKVNRGERTTLRVGDSIHCLKNADGKTHYIYTVSRGVEMIEAEHECQHVTEDVQWYEWDGKSGFGQDGYYVLSQDAELTNSITIEAGTEITLCLNGHTVSSNVRFFKVYGTLNICDHKDADGNYQGKLTSSYSHTVDAEGNVTAKAYAALAYLYNASASSELNIYGGIFEHTGKLTNGGLVYIANASDDENNTAVFSLYDGILTGGKTTGGGAGVYISNIGGFAMYGGTITDCASDSDGGGVYLQSSKGVILMDGGFIRDCTAEGVGAGVQLNNGTMLMTGGIITGNTSTGSGGGISLDGGELLMTGGTLDGNTGKEGGNLRLTRYASVVLSGDAKVINGISTGTGGNITMFGSLTVMDNVQITGGTSGGSGSAISVFSNYDDSEVELSVLGGNIEGTIRYASKKGVSVRAYLMGGTVDTFNAYNTADATVQTEIYVGGNVNVKNLYLAKGHKINIYEDSLEDTASIGISMEDMTAAFATITDPNDEACFRAADESLYKVENVDNDLYLVSSIAPHIHCICGGHLTDANVGSHTVCDGTVEWTLWDGTTGLADGGHYYLYDTDGDGKIAVTAQTTIAANAEVSLCLNGVTLEGSTARIFQVNGGSETTVFNICDCHEEENWGGLSSTGSGVAPLIHSYTNNRGHVQINIFGGNFQSVETEPTDGDSAGLIRLGNTGSVAAGEEYHGVLNLYDGNLMNGSAKSGGNLYVSYGCTFNMYGGSITGGYASGNGGNIYLASSASMHIEGDVNISGAADGGNLYLTDGDQMTVGDLADTAFVGISMSKPGQFAMLADPNDAGCFQSDDSAYIVDNQEGVLSLISQASGTTHSHCLCNGNAVGLGDHVCDNDTSWTEWRNESALPTTSGNYYLSVDVTLSDMFEMKGKLDLRICLNSHTITGPGGGKRAFLLRDADLHITDCRGTGKITNEATSSLNGGLIYQYGGSSCNDYNNSVNLYGGTLTSTGTAKSGGVLYLGNNYNKPYYPTFNLYGGTVTGGKTTSMGGNITMTNQAVLNVYAGAISNGDAGGVGGNISQNSGSGRIFLLGGTVTGGKSATSGSDLYVDEVVTLGGQVKIGEMFLKDAHTVDISSEMPLTGDASVGIKKSIAELFATNVADETVAEFFKQLGTAWNVEYDATEKTLSFTE